MGPGRGRAHPPHDHPPPHRRRPDVGRDLGGRRVRDAGRRRDLVDPQQGRPRGVQPREPLPRLRPVRPQAGAWRRTATSGCTSRTTAASTARPTAARSGRRSRATCRATSASSMTAHPRDPMTVWNIPLTDPEQGRLMPGGLRGGVADARRRRHVDPVGRRPAPGERLRRACCARRWRTTTATRSASTSGRARARCTGPPTRAATWSRIADNLPPIWSVEALALD